MQPRVVERLPQIPDLGPAIPERRVLLPPARRDDVSLDVRAPRDAPIKQFMAYLFEPAPGHPMRPQGQAVSIAVTPEQARELLAAGAEWTGPAHMRAEVLPGA